MRFALAALFALATSVSASVNAAARDLEACACTPDRLNATGINIGQDEDTYSCSYATGACLRTRAGVLINTEQLNCYCGAQPCVTETQ